MQKVIRLIILLGLFFLTGAAWAQNDTYETMEAAKTALERTDQIIAQAKEAVAESGSERARNLLEAAVSLQRRAHNMFRSMDQTFGSTAGRQLGKYTLSSREKAKRAIAVTRQAEENESYVRRRLEMTDEIIRRIEENTDANTPENILLVLESAQKKQQRARELYRNRRLKMSMQLTLQTRKSLEKMVEQVSGFMKVQKHQRILQDRYFTLLDRIELSGFAERAEVKNRIQRAEQLRQQADALATDNRFIKAEGAMQEAVEILSRIAERIKEPERIRSSLGDLVNRMEEISFGVESSGNRQALKWYNNAREHLAKASAFYQDGNFEAAAAQLQATRQILTRIARLLEE